ncbi:hypothetical protein COV24_04740 [candidate division WWE3 bacterium CG10_big_fil_rev_8_21_14_0_10_32_10]|uniref:Uncharacterized protein n=1 Tax=candidate division WWE3 bacterium CG10_big_fil_rev_8_21_14_0_10_32_10 TaxID=1975090 RepID=A0A2H0R998_UNCKA|nr:MAG: hypothetical protein COV24_04740 [candidate division WWE3 bacterium CG10_big_fil_rev_8_21_14_0_10_32_10]
MNGKFNFWYFHFMKSIYYLFVAIIGLFLYNINVVSANYGLSQTQAGAKLPASGTVSGIIGNIIGAGLSFVGVLFFLLMIYAGIKWMLSKGNEQEATKALHTITAAIIGLIIVVSAYAITNFIFSAVEGTGQSTQLTCETVTSCEVDADCLGGTCAEVPGGGKACIACP